MFIAITFTSLRILAFTKAVTVFQTSTKYGLFFSYSSYFLFPFDIICTLQQSRKKQHFFALIFLAVPPESHRISIIPNCVCPRCTIIIVKGFMSQGLHQSWMNAKGLRVKRNLSKDEINTLYQKLCIKTLANKSRYRVFHIEILYVALAVYNYLICQMLDWPNWWKKYKLLLIC